MAPAQSKLARSPLAYLQGKGGSAASLALPLLIALYYLRKRFVDAAAAAKLQSEPSFPLLLDVRSRFFPSRSQKQAANSRHLSSSSPSAICTNRECSGAAATRMPADPRSCHRLPNGSRELLVPNRGRVSKVVIHPTKQSTFDAHRPLFHPPTPPSFTTSDGKPSPTSRVGVNKVFFKQLSAIFKILIPRVACKETFLIAAHTSFLLLRTYLSLLVAKLDGRLVGDLVSRPRLSTDTPS